MLYYKLLSLYKSTGGQNACVFQLRNDNDTTFSLSHKDFL